MQCEGDGTVLSTIITEEDIGTILVVDVGCLSLFGAVVGTPVTDLYSYVVEELRNIEL